MDIVEALLAEHDDNTDEIGDLACVAHAEGLWCCLDEENPRGQVIRGMLKDLVALANEVADWHTIDEITVEHRRLEGGVCHLMIDGKFYVCLKHNEE